ncbi:uncharacterized protein LOC122372884 [Amphibalanus amphitrite]|uniref:uncharacterized protein LOC122372884 n=1 Tax=Amphibalanus amphitrite TaxID=1232801 RepID=UPI001C90BBE2|nr:uncharacterized protein LOC122372884 [Amphibalanus amphitrite]
MPRSAPCSSNKEDGTLTNQTLPGSREQSLHPIPGADALPPPTLIPCGARNLDKEQMADATNTGPPDLPLVESADDATSASLIEDQTEPTSRNVTDPDSEARKTSQTTENETPSTQTMQPENADVDDSDSTVVRDTGYQEVAAESHKSDAESESDYAPGRRRVKRRRIIRPLSSDSSEEEEQAASRRNTRNSRRSPDDESAKHQPPATRSSRRKTRSSLVQKVVEPDDTDDGSVLPARSLRKRRKDSSRSLLRQSEDVNIRASPRLAGIALVNVDDSRGTRQYRSVADWVDDAPFDGFYLSSVDSHLVSAKLRRWAQSHELKLARMVAQSRTLTRDSRSRSAAALTQCEGRVNDASVAESTAGSASSRNHADQSSEVSMLSEKTASQMRPCSSRNASDRAGRRAMAVEGIEIGSTEDDAASSSPTRTRSLRRQRNSTTPSQSPRQLRHNLRSASVGKTAGGDHESERKHSLTAERRRTKATETAEQPAPGNVPATRRRGTPLIETPDKAETESSTTELRRTRTSRSVDEAEPALEMCRLKSRATETASESEVSPTSRRRRSRTSETSSETAVEPSVPEVVRRRMPTRQDGIEDGSTGLRSPRAGRPGLRRERRAVETDSGDENAKEVGTKVSPLHPQSPLGQKNSERSNLVETASPMRQLRSRKCSDAVEVASSLGENLQASSHEVSPAGKAVNEDQPKTSASSEKLELASSDPPSLRHPSKESSEASHLQVPARNLAVRPSALSEEPRADTSNPITSSALSSVTIAPTRLAIHPVEALLRPSRVLRARPTARQVSMPGSRLSMEPSKAASFAGKSDPLVPSVSKTYLSQATSKNPLPTGEEGCSNALAQLSSKDNVVVNAYKGETTRSDVCDQAQASEDMEHERAETLEQQPTVGGEADEAVDDNHEWAAEVSSDSDSSGDNDSRLMIEDGSMDMTQDSTEPSARCVEEAHTGDAEREIVDDGSRDRVRGEVAKAGVEDSLTDEGRSESPKQAPAQKPGRLPQRERKGSDEGTLGKFTRVKPGPISYPDTGTETRCRPTKVRRETRAGDLTATKAVGREGDSEPRKRKKRASEGVVTSALTKEAYAPERAVGLPTMHPTAQENAAAKRSCKQQEHAASQEDEPEMDTTSLPDSVSSLKETVEPASGARKGRKKQKRPLSPPSDDVIETATPQINQDVDVSESLPQRPAAPNVFVRPSRPVSVTGSLEGPPRKEVGRGSRLLAKLRRANSRSSATPTLPSRVGAFATKTSSQTPVISSAETTTRLVPRITPSVEVQNEYRQSRPPPEDLEALGAWASRPRESKLRSSDGSAEAYPLGRSMTGSDLLTEARERRRAPLRKSLSHKTDATFEKLQKASGKSDSSMVTKHGRLDMSSSSEFTRCSDPPQKTSPTHAAPGASNSVGVPPKLSNITVGRAERQKPAQPTPALLEEVEDHRPPTKRPRMAHQAAPTTDASSRVKTSAPRVTHRKTSKQNETQQLPSFYQLLEKPPTPSPAMSPASNAGWSQMSPHPGMSPSPNTSLPPMWPSVAMSSKSNARLPQMPTPLPVASLRPAVPWETTPARMSDTPSVMQPTTTGVESATCSTDASAILSKIAAGPLSEADLALLIGQLVNEQPNTAGWKQLLVRVGGSNATDESIVSHLCHRMALIPESPPPQPKDERGTFDLTAEPAPEVARVCACAVQLQRRNRPRLQALLRTACREQLLRRQPELPLPARRQLLRLHAALCRLWGATSECRSLLLDVALRHPAELCSYLLAVMSSWPRAFGRRKDISISPLERVLLCVALVSPSEDQQEVIGTLQPLIRASYGRVDTGELGICDAEMLADRLVIEMTESDTEDASLQHCAALLLLSAIRGPKWTNDCPLEKAVVPLLARRSDAGNRTMNMETGAAAAVRLTGDLAAFYQTPTDRLMEEAVCILEGVTLHGATDAASPVTSAARYAIDLLLRRHLPEETDRRLRQCLSALPEVTENSATYSSAAGESAIYSAAGDSSAIYTASAVKDNSATYTAPGATSVICGAVGASGDSRAIRATNLKTGVVAAATCRPVDEARPVTRWFGTTDEYF